MKAQCSAPFATTRTLTSQTSLVGRAYQWRQMSTLNARRRKNGAHSNFSALVRRLEISVEAQQSGLYVLSSSFEKRRSAS
jgi:hypothetical protein